MVLSFTRKFGRNNAKYISVEKQRSFVESVTLGYMHEIDIYGRMSMNEQVLVLFMTVAPVGKHGHRFLGQRRITFRIHVYSHKASNLNSTPQHSES